MTRNPCTFSESLLYSFLCTTYYATKSCHANCSIKIKNSINRFFPLLSSFSYLLLVQKYKECIYRFRQLIFFLLRVFLTYHFLLTLSIELFKKHIEYQLIFAELKLYRLALQTSSRRWCVYQSLNPLSGTYLAKNTSLKTFPKISLASSIACI